MNVIRTVALALSVLWVGGCAVTTASGTRLRVGSDEFSAYAERVFREQNRVASRLAFALADTEAADGPRYRALADAEDALLDACRGLNEIAARRRDGDRPGALRGLRAAHEAPACERAAAAAAAVLDRS